MKDKDFYYIKKLRYELDDFISKGFWNQVLLLIACGLVIIVIFGLILYLFLGDKTLPWSIWQSLMHLIDQGTITADDTSNLKYLFFMLLITFLGMAFTSTIIGVVGNGIEEKIDEMKKGHSAVIEKNHIVILGFNDNTHTLIDELIQLNKEIKGIHNVVIVDDLSKEEMEHDAQEAGWCHLRYDNEKKEKKLLERKTTTIFRSGDLLSDNTYPICGLERARAIIINGKDDYEKIQILLSVSKYLKDSGKYLGDEEMPRILCLIHDIRNISAARIAAGLPSDPFDSDVKNENENRVMIFNSKLIMMKVVVELCLSTELKIDRKSVLSAIDSSDAKIDIKENDYYRFLFIGKINNLPVFTGETENIDEIMILADKLVDDPYDWYKLKQKLDERPEWFSKDGNMRLTNIFIVSDDEEELEESDKKTIALLLNLRAYLEKNCDYRIKLTTQMNSPKNQALVQKQDINDLVVSTQFANRYLVQYIGK